VQEKQLDSIKKLTLAEKEKVLKLFIWIVC